MIFAFPGQLIGEYILSQLSRALAIVREKRLSEDWRGINEVRNS